MIGLALSWPFLYKLNMRKFSEADKKEIQNIFIMLNKAYFKDLSMSEIISIGGLRKYLADLYDEIDRDLKEVADATTLNNAIANSVVDPIKIDMGKTKKKVKA